ncbi:MAG: histidine phosphatase family protein [Bacteroidota bacterium]
MKKLFLIRHAKSSHDDLKMKDIDRPLNNRGLTDAAMMAKIIHQKEIKPDLIFSSPAKRALETAKIFAKELNYSADAILIDPVLYSFNAELILSFISEIDADAETVFLFSHNPTFHELANHFTKNNIPSMPTCCIVGISIDCNSWSEVEESDKQLSLYEFPKKYRAGDD